MKRVVERMFVAFLPHTHTQCTYTIYITYNTRVVRVFITIQIQSPTLGCCDQIITSSSATVRCFLFHNHCSACMYCIVYYIFFARANDGNEMSVYGWMDGRISTIV